MKFRDPRILFGASVLGVFALLALTDGDPAPFVFKPVPFSPVPNPDAFAPSTGPVNLTRHLSDQFFRDIIKMAEDYRARGAKIIAEDILAVLNAESGIFPGARNKLSSCAGMNQICPTVAADPLSGLKSVGFGGGLNDYLALSAEAQLPFVRRFFDNVIKGRFSLLTNMGKLYLLNFNPGHLAQSDDFHLYDRDASDVNCKRAYCQNAAALDPEKKGFIAVSDMDKFVKRSTAANGPFGKSSPPFAYWKELKGRLLRVSGQAIAGLNDEEAMIRIALSSMGRI